MAALKQRARGQVNDDVDAAAADVKPERVAKLYRLGIIERPSVQKAGDTISARWRTRSIVVRYRNLQRCWVMDTLSERTSWFVLLMRA